MVSLGVRSSKDASEAQGRMEGMKGEGEEESEKRETEELDGNIEERRNGGRTWEAGQEETYSSL
eukprot:7582741-Pyramimonas_sp.AAC.1